MLKMIHRVSIAFQILLLLNKTPNLGLHDLPNLLADRFGLSSEDFDNTSQIEKSNQWEDDVRIAIAHLKKIKLLRQKGHIISISEKGQQKLNQLFFPLNH